MLEIFHVDEDVFEVWFNGEPLTHVDTGTDVLEEALVLWFSPGEILKRASLRRELSDTERIILDRSRQQAE